jgi:hypothetical protein
MYSTTPDPIISYSSPKILYQDDHFLTADEIKMYQQFLLTHTWGVGPGGLENILYVSKDLYCHYKWDGNWDAAHWADNEPVEWEHLYQRIAKHLARHYLHWCDAKITSFGQQGTPLHRDKDPWTPGGDTNKFSRAITVLCNLNSQWDPAWGGGIQLYSSDKSGLTLTDTVPIVPGQLLIMENCYHSIEPITQIGKSRVSFIVHVLEYR